MGRTMDFSVRLGDYLRQAGVSQKELAAQSGLSEATVSRFCSGKKEPSFNGDETELLARGIAELARQKGSQVPPFEEIYASLRGSLSDMLRVDYEVFLGNLNYLLKSLGVKNSELAAGIYSDLSHVSRILSGVSRPGNPNAFIHDTASYLALRFAGSSEMPAIARIIGVSAEDISTSQALREWLVVFLGCSDSADVRGGRDDPLPRFLASLDDFDLNDYLKAVHFDEIKLPPAMPHLPTRREYTGIKKMMESELDFMRTTVLSKSMDDCILYSDMPLEEMSADPEFPKKYMFGMAMMLKKGLHLNVIHDVNRPFQEMMLGLESWIPLYMTGQISPFYFSAAQNQVFLHFLKVSGAAALEGSAIVGNQGSGKYVLYRSKEDVKHYRARAGQMLKKASSLMDIYQKDRAELFHMTLKRSFADSDCKMICSNLPVYFLPEELLDEILERAGAAEKPRRLIKDYHKAAREEMLSLLENNRLHLIIPDAGTNIKPDNSSDNDAKIGRDIRPDTDTVPVPGKDKNKNKAGSVLPRLALADTFLEQEIALTIEEYERCTEAITSLASQYPNLKTEYSRNLTFHNINITIAGEKMVIVSKEKSPAIHFVIHHKKMIRAFKNFIPPIVDE